MDAFFLPPGTPVAFGPGRLVDAGRLVEGLLGRKSSVLLIADPFAAENGLADRVAGILSATGHGVTLVSEISSEPASVQIEHCAEKARSAAVAAIVAVGGGSAMDSGKLAAAAAAEQRTVEDYARPDSPAAMRALPVLCVPTTAGTGAEVSRAVSLVTAAGRKVWIRGEGLKPALALLDPELTVSLPANLTAATGVDALVHAIEAMTNRRAHPLSDAYALHAIRLVARNLRQAVKKPEDLELRGSLQIAAVLAGLAVDVNGTAVAQALGHALRTLAKVHHGRAAGLALRVALPGNCKASRERHARVAEALGLEHVGRKDEALAAALPAAFDTFLREVGLEIGLKSSGLGPADLDRLIAAVLRPENRPLLEATCRRLGEGEIRELCQALLTAR